MVTAIAECDINSSTITSEVNLLSVDTTSCIDDFSVTFSPENDVFSVVLIHEPTTSQLENGTIGTFGVVEYKSNNVISTQGDYVMIDNSIIVIGFILLGFALVFKMRRNN